MEIKSLDTLMKLSSILVTQNLNWIISITTDLPKSVQWNITSLILEETEAQ